MNHPLVSRRLSGMTLTELLVVLAILGVLLLLAFPVLEPLFTKTHKLEAKTNLKHLAELQRAYYLEHLSYTDDFASLGFQQAPLVSDANGTAHYQIEIIEVDRTSFVARATAVTDFDNDGQLNVWEITKDGIPNEVVDD